MKNFSLAFSSVLIALFYVSLERPNFSVPFLVFCVLLVENALQIRKKTSGRMLSGSTLTDFRFRYAESQSTLLYAVSLITIFIVYALIRNAFVTDLVPYALLANALIFVIFRMGVINISQYFESATIVSTSDYHDKFDHRNSNELLKKDLDNLLSQCISNSTSTAFNIELLNSKKALYYSSNLDINVKPLIQQMNELVSRGDYEEAGEMLRKINVLI